MRAWPLPFPGRVLRKGFWPTAARSRVKTSRNSRSPSDLDCWKLIKMQYYEIMAEMADGVVESFGRDTSWFTHPKGKLFAWWGVDGLWSLRLGPAIYSALEPCFTKEKPKQVKPQEWALGCLDLSNAWQMAGYTKATRTQGTSRWAEQDLTLVGIDGSVGSQISRLQMQHSFSMTQQVTIMTWFVLRDYKQRQSRPWTYLKFQRSTLL